MNCRPQPYQGCALPLSYGGERRGGPDSECRRRGEAKSVLTGRLRRRTHIAMTKDDDKAAPPKGSREEKLAAALRANLRRRKAGAAAAAKAEKRD